MPTLEICVDNPEGLQVAVKNGADRIELCAALDLGGLSPSVALLEAAQDCPVPVNVMIRPWPGGFEWADADIALLIKEIEMVGAQGFAGVVIGAGSRHGLEMAALSKMADAARGMDITLHRVVDLLPDRLPILEPVAAMGINRILTSGGQKRAVDGIADIANLIRNCPPELTIMPGAGVSPVTINQIISQTGAREIHASARQAGDVADALPVSLGFEPDPPRQTNGATVRALKSACHKLAVT